MQNLKKIIIKRYNNIKILEKYKQYSFSGLKKIELKLINKFVKKNSKILDVACGSGRVLLVLAKKHDVYGIDISKKMVFLTRQNLIKRKLKAKLEVMDACSLKYKNKSFDCVLFLGNGFEQIPEKMNRIKALEEIFRVLKQNGIFILTTQSALFPDFKIWVLLFFQYVKYHLFKKIKEFEFGDLILKDITDVYIHISNPFFIKKRLKHIGFNLIKIVSEKNKKFPYFTKGLIYYVARKQSIKRFKRL